MSLLDSLFKKRHEQKRPETPQQAAHQPKIVKPPTRDAKLAKPAGNPLGKLLQLSKLNETEKGELKDILKKYASSDSKLELDLDYLVNITSEIKAINNQAIILHGERISKAQRILKSYKDGAFTAWLIATYGNRQTPYNFLQYFNFYRQLPQTLHPKFEKMPRQAVYALASREGALDKKLGLVKGFAGQSKQQLLKEIREVFPLNDQDKRKQRTQEHIINSLQKTYEQLKEQKNFTDKNKTKLKAVLKKLETIID
ncbi:MAG: hypothetical protein GWP59_07730 [Chlamydiales bacterium]|nr:hypothetical protein [Chlamydiales bacterium]